MRRCIVPHWMEIRPPPRLLAQGADPNWHNDDNRWTALMVAVTEGHDAVATTLLADPPLDVTARDDRGRTALHLAAERGDAGLASRLAQAADVNAKDDDGVTPLMRAAYRPALGGDGRRRRRRAPPAR